MMNDLKKRKKSPYSHSFEKKVQEARASKAKGELIEVNPENVWESIESGPEQQSLASDQGFRTHS